jgi:hypothetical protein
MQPRVPNEPGRARGVAAAGRSMAAFADGVDEAFGN